MEAHEPGEEEGRAHPHAPRGEPGVHRDRHPGRRGGAEAPSALADERPSAPSSGRRAPRGPGRIPQKGDGGQGHHRHAEPGARAREPVPLARRHHHAEVRRHSECRQQRHAGMLPAVPFLHRQRHPYLRRDPAEAGVRRYHEKAGARGARGAGEGHPRVQPPVQICDPYRRTDSPGTPHRPPQGAAVILLPLLPEGRGFGRCGEHRILLHLHRRLHVPAGGGGEDSRLDSGGIHSGDRQRPRGRIHRIQEGGS